MDTPTEEHLHHPENPPENQPPRRLALAAQLYATVKLYLLLTFIAVMSTLLGIAGLLTFWMVVLMPIANLDAVLNR